MEERSGYRADGRVQTWPVVAETMGVGWQRRKWDPLRAIERAGLAGQEEGRLMNSEREDFRLTLGAGLDRLGKQRCYLSKRGSLAEDWVLQL